MSTARGSHLTRVLEFDVVFLRRFLGTGLDLSPEGVARVDEAALRISLNGPELLHAQLDHRLAMNERSIISVQIAQLGFGGHAAGGGPFSILRFAVPDLSDTVYLEMTERAAASMVINKTARSALAP
jgi:hypothetical protein